MSLEIPSFLNRKETPRPQATVEERRDYAASCTAPVFEERRCSTIDHEEVAEERKQKARVRIQKMKAKKFSKDQTAGIPEKFLFWNSKKLRFEDTRARAARRLVIARKQMGLD